MKVENMVSSRGKKVPNQFIVSGDDGSEIFQSYETVIAKKDPDGQIYLDSDAWDYSVTTGKYRNEFLGETKKETQSKINSGEYLLTNLN